MNLVGVFQNDQAGVVIEADAELFARGTAVGEQARAKAGIDPRPRHHLGAQCGRARIQYFDLPTDFARADQLLLDQELAHRRFHDFEIAGHDIVCGARMVVRMTVILIVVRPLIRRHAHILSSQVSNTSMRNPSFGDPA
jgi:hypothetical protein